MTTAALPTASGERDARLLAAAESVCDALGRPPAPTPAAVYGRLRVALQGLFLARYLHDPGADDDPSRSAIADLGAVAWQAFLEGRPAGDQPAAPAFDLADAAADQAPVADWDDAVGRLAVEVDRVAVELRAGAGRLLSPTFGRIAALAARALADLDCSERDEPEDA